MDYSIIIPVYNEADSLIALKDRIIKTFEDMPEMVTFEIVFIDDGSSDDSKEIINTLAEHYPEVTGVFLRRNCGKSMALSAGFMVSKGARLITMDGDLQDCPEDIPALIETLEQGYDVVSGWRKKRSDTSVRKLGSRLYNRTVSHFSGLKLHDHNCGFKIYKRSVVNSLRIYGDFHRYIPLLAHAQGFKVSEARVNNDERKFGESKYPTFRYKGAFDLMTVLFINRFGLNPMHFFANLSLVFIIPSVICLLILTGSHFLSWFGLGSQLEIRPLLSLSLTALMLGINIFLTGFVCDFILHHTHRKQHDERIRQDIGFTTTEHTANEPTKIKANLP